METIAAVGFAASILTFIDFSTTLLKGTFQVYQSATGTTAENADLAKILDDLQDVTHELTDDSFKPRDKHERALATLARQCVDVSKELQRVLQTLKAKDPHSKWESARVKLRSMRKEGEIASIEKRLGEHKTQLLLRLSFMMRFAFTPKSLPVAPDS
jgi:hypothetical protein